MATFLARAAGLVDLPAPVGTQPEQPPPFDPFSTPTVSDIDLERLADAVETLDEEAVCPPTRVRGSLADVAEVVRISGGCLYVEYVPLGGRTVDQVRELLASDPEVHAVDLPVIDVYPSDFHYDDRDYEQWHLERIEANNLWYGGVGADGLRVLSGWPAGADVVVAVIDDGVDGSHPDLDANLITRGDSCHRSPHKNNKGELNDHGTHVAGIIGAERNGRDVVGVAPDARILPIKIHFGDDFEKDQEGEFIEDSNGDRVPLDSHCYSLVRSTADAVRLAIEQGADVINMSYGGPIRSMTDEAVLRAAMMRDIVAVAAAGNCGRNTAASLNANNCSSMHNLAKYPAAYPGVIAVANTTVNASGDDERAATSTANRHVGIAAPGSGILSTVLPYPAVANNPHCDKDSTCYVRSYSGTSQAAPVISGVVAHMKARFPKASVSEIRQALYATAQQPGSGGTGRWTPEFGWGIVTPAHAIWDLTKYFFSCDAVLGQDRGLVAYDIDVDIDADGDTVDDDRVELFERRDVWVADGNGDVWCRVAHNAAHPAWSPDGQHLTFAHRLPDPHQVLATNDEGHTVLKWVDEGRVDIWVMPAAGGPWRRVTDTEAEEYDLDWSRSGQIVYTANTGAGFEIWVVDASGDTPPRNLTGHLAGSQFQPSWSPVGTRIAYASDQDGDNDIWVMNADGTGHRNLTTGNITVDGRSLADSKEEQPAWSPDGTRIVYVSDRGGGDNDIWVMNADGTGHRVLHDNNNPESKPEWSPDGSRIIFVYNTGRPGTDDDIWTMDAKTGLDWELITTATAEDLRFNAAAESNPTWSPTDAPPPDDRQVKISWGNDATSRPDCPTGEVCLDLRYEFIGTWDPAPYTLECWSGNNRSWVGQWSGQPEHGCYYWGEPAHVVIDGIRSNTITWTAPPPPDDRQVRIWWGSDATGRVDCPTGEVCLDLRYEFIGTWDPAPYTLECWSGNNRSWVGQWAGQPEHGCYYWGEPAHVVIDGIRSNTITWTAPPGPVGTPSCGPGSSDGTPCEYLIYEEAFDDDGNGFADRSEIWVSSADGSDKRKLVDGSDPIWSPDGSKIVYLAKSGYSTAMWVMSVDGTGAPRKLHDPVWRGEIDKKWLWSPDSTYVAYTTFEHDDNDRPADRTELWAAAVDGSSPSRRLADSVSFYSDRPWSPNSAHVAYIVDIHNDDDGYSDREELWVAAVDGSSPPRRFSADTGRIEFSWSPVRERIVFTTRTTSGDEQLLHLQLEMRNADGTNAQVIADDGAWPVWSPDGAWIEYGIRFGGRWVVAADGSGTPRQFAGRGVEGRAWSPDGRRIAYTERVDDDGDGSRDRYELRIVAADGSGEPIPIARDAELTGRLVTGRAIKPEQRTALWSEDGTHFAYFVNVRQALANQGYRILSEELWVAPSDGSGKPCRLTTSGAMGGWSPSGEHVAYGVLVDDDGDTVADRKSWWVARADCTGTRKLTDGGWVEGWSPTGTHIAYSVPVDADNDGKPDRVEVWIVDIAGGGPPLLVTSDAPVYTYPSSSSSAWSPV